MWRPSCFCCLWPRWCSGRRRARPPARLGILTSFGAAPRSPPVPSGPSGALHTGGAWSLGCGLARRLEARPGPAATHRHRGPAPQAPRRPPIGRACVSWPCRHAPAPRLGPAGPTVGHAAGSGTCFRGMYSAISHAIPSEQLACLCHFVSLSHTCLGIACDFGVGCGWGGIVGSGEGRIGGVAVGVAGVSWGADLVRMSAPGSFWGLDGTEVLCFRRWEEV